MKLFLHFIFSCLTFISYSQITLFNDDFETAGVTWTSIDNLTPNFWTTGTCAGNGPSNAGSTSMNITIGGGIAGCGPTGLTQYSYSNSPSGIQKATNHATVDATCATNIQVQFDYQISSETGVDFGEFIYSIDNGASWIVESTLNNTIGWNTYSTILPSSLNGTTFEIGFRFNYNDNTIVGNPLSIDNILVTGTDSIDPIITCPVSVETAVNANCLAYCDDYTKNIITLSDNCTDSLNITLSQNIPEFTLFLAGPGGTENIIITAFDETGNSSQCLIAVNIIDNISPTGTCPPDTNLYVNNSCDVILGDYTSLVNVMDNCSSASNISITQSPIASTIINGQNITTNVIMTFTDESGNNNTCSFNTLTIDTILPTIICPSDTNIYANSSCNGTIGTYGNLAIINDNCVLNSAMTVTQSPSPGTTITSNQVITLTLNGGIPSTPQQCTFNAIFVDTIAPSILCPIPNDIILNGSCEGILTDYTSSALTNENCTISPLITQSPAPGTTLSGVSNFNVTLTVTDAAGNSNQCNFTQQVIDNSNPIIICPSNQTENANINCFAVLSDYTGLGSVTDNCSSSLTISQTPTPGTTISNTTTITLSASDGNGNNGSCTFTTSIVDVTAPTISCPLNVTVNTDSGCGYVLTDYTSSAIAADNCTAAGSIVKTQNPLPGVVLPLGINTITITAQDLSGNSDFCTFEILVEDQVNPVITTCANNQNVYMTASCNGLISDYTSLITATDNCSNSMDITLTQSPISGTSISSDQLIVITAEDEAGNSTTCQFNALVIDTIKPTISCPGNQTVAINSSCQYPIPNLVPLITGTDNCSAVSNLVISQNPIAGSTQNGATAVLITISDEQSNQNTCIVNIIPNDIDPPTITCPSPAAENVGTLCDFIVPNYMSTSIVIDNCSNYTISQSPAVGSVINTGSTEFTLIVTDVGGNTDQCSFFLDVFETESPTIVCPSNISSCTPTTSYSLPTYNDNCFAFLTQTDLTGLSSGMDFPIGITTLEYTVEDSSSNSQTCSFTVEILDYPSDPSILEDTVYLCAQNAAVITANAATSGIGEWTLTSGSGFFNNQFANTTGVNNIGSGYNLYTWTISTASCGSLSDSVYVYNAQQDLTASTQDTIYGCLNTSVQLQSNTPLYGIGTWTTSGNGTITDPNSSSTTSSFSGGWQDFIWTISNLGCPDSSDTLRVFGMNIPEIVESDTLICLENSSITLNGSTPFIGQSSSWEVISGSASINTPLNQNTLVTGFNSGTTIIQYSLNSELCPSTSSQISISANLCDEFGPIIPTVITPGNLDGINDVFVIDFLSTVYPECYVQIFNRWGSLVFESVGYNEPWNGTYKGEPLPMGTYFYNIELNEGSNTIIKGDISIVQ